MGGCPKAYQARRLDPAATFKSSKRQDGLLRVRLQLVGLEEDGERGRDSTPGEMKLLRLPARLPRRLTSFGDYCRSNGPRVG